MPVGKADLNEVLPAYLKDWDWKGSVDQFIAAWLEHENVVDARLINVIQCLRKNGFLCCLATSQERNRAEYMKTKMGFQEAFDRLFFSCEIGCQKPDYSYYQYIERMLDREKESILFLDDREKCNSSPRIWLECRDLYRIWQVGKNHKKNTILKKKRLIKDHSMPFLPTEIPNLSTSRLLLRQIMPEDNEAVFSLYCDPDVMQYHNLEVFTTVEQADAFIQRVMDRISQGEAIRWGITQPEPGTIIGTCGFTSILSSNYSGRVGYELQQLYWHKGIMSEALASILSFGFSVLPLHRIEALVMLENHASNRTLERLGFTKEGILRDYGYWKGSYWRPQRDPYGCSISQPASHPSSCREQDLNF